MDRPYQEAPIHFGHSQTGSHGVTDFRKFSHVSDLSTPPPHFQELDLEGQHSQEDTNSLSQQPDHYNFYANENLHSSHSFNPQANFSLTTSEPTHDYDARQALGTDRSQHLSSNLVSVQIQRSNPSFPSSHKKSTFHQSSGLQRKQKTKKDTQNSNHKTAPNFCKSSIQVVCRIKPAISKLQFEKQITKRSRVNRSNTRGGSCLRSGFSLPRGSLIETPQGHRKLVDSGHDELTTARDHGRLSMPSMANGTALRNWTKSMHYSPTKLTHSKSSSLEPVQGSVDIHDGSRGHNHLIMRRQYSHRKVGRRSASVTAPMAKSRSVLFYDKMLKSDALYNIFTTRDASARVFASDQPFSGKFLNESFVQGHEQKFMESLSLQFKLDAVFDETSAGRQDKVYFKAIRPKVQSLFEGQNSAIFLFGPSNSGKTFSLKGGQGSERGMVPRVIEDILETIKGKRVAQGSSLDSTPNFSTHSVSLRLQFSVYMVHKDGVCDLLGYQPQRQGHSELAIQRFRDSSSGQMDTELRGLTKREIRSAHDFYEVIAQAYKYRKELATNLFQDFDIRKKSHFVVQLELEGQFSENQRFETVSRMSFVELAGSEQAVNHNQKSDPSTSLLHDFVSASFNGLSGHLIKLAYRKRKNQTKPASTPDDREPLLLSCLRSTMNATSNILVINCVDPNPSAFEHSLPSLKFCASIRQQINKKTKTKVKPSPQKAPQSTEFHPRQPPEKPWDQERHRESRTGIVNSRGSDDFITVEVDNALTDRDQLQSQRQGSFQQRSFQHDPQVINMPLQQQSHQQSFNQGSQKPYLGGMEFSTLDQRQNRQTNFSNLQQSSFQTVHPHPQSSLNQVPKAHFDQNSIPESLNQINGEGSNKVHCCPPDNHDQSLQRDEKINLRYNPLASQSARNRIQAPTFTSLTTSFKHKNLIQASESRFAQLRQEIVKPTLVSLEDLPSLEEVKNNMPVKLEGRQTLAEEFRDKQPLYRSEEEVAQDTIRMMLLQDQQGLKMRVLQLFRDRTDILAQAQVYIDKQITIQRECQALTSLNSEFKQALVQNNEDTQTYLRALEKGYRVVETELVDQIRNLENQVETLTKESADTTENMAEAVKQRDQATDDRTQEHKLRVEAESKCKEVEGQNQKLLQNYEILKEHEMSIIRDCENKKSKDIASLQELLSKTKRDQLSAEDETRICQSQISLLKEKVSELESCLRVEKDKTKDQDGKIGEQSAEITSLREQNAKIKQQASEDVQFISVLKQEVQSLQIKRDDAQKEVQEFKRKLQESDRASESQFSNFRKMQAEVKLLNESVDSLKADKSNLRKELADQKKEMGVMVDNFRFEKEQLEKEVGEVNEELRHKERELVNLKAREFDKVDVYKKIAELETKAEVLAGERDSIQGQRDQWNHKYQDVIRENELLLSSYKEVQDELAKEKKLHAENLDDFDGKFDTVREEIDALRGENSGLRERMNDLRRQLSEADGDKNFWREKCRTAESKGEEINAKISELENELKFLLCDRNSSALQTIAGSKGSHSMSSLPYRPNVEGQRPPGSSRKPPLNIRDSYDHVDKCGEEIIRHRQKILSSQHSLQHATEPSLQSEREERAEIFVPKSSAQKSSKNSDGHDHILNHRNESKESYLREDEPKHFHSFQPSPAFQQTQTQSRQSTSRSGRVEELGD